VDRASEIDWSRLEGIRSLGVSAGASAPEKLVDEVIEAFAERFDITVEARVTAQENIAFNIPRELRTIEAGVAR
jgi:4-hydroxy-3-methylbut-2-enyl diphosphate reductase